MTAKEKLATINALLEKGKAATFWTATRGTRIDAKCVARFARRGRPLLKVVGESLMLSSGNRYVCVDYCRITSDAD